MISKRLIYLDNNATTKIDPRVLDSMMPFLTSEYGNASSSHNFGSTINESIRTARENVAELIGANKSEIVFTSGATESINLALKGFAMANQEKGKHIITVETEHKAVLDTCKYLETVGFQVSYLRVNEHGLVKLQDLKDELRPDSIMVCVMLVNNEIGVIQPIKEISKITRAAGAFLLSDATQAVGKIDVNVDDLDVDLLAFSGHKFHAPKGVGCLYVKGVGHKKFRLDPLLHGGGHENALRSGTLNVAGIVGMGKASEIALKDMTEDARRISLLRDELEVNLLRLPNVYVNGPVKTRMYNISNLCFPGIDANMMIGQLRNVALSNGSACTSSVIEPSHVLKAIGLSDADAMSSIRFSLGRFNTREDILTVTALFNEALSSLLINRS
jgi:cysteine desulfurase